MDIFASIGVVLCITFFVISPYWVRALFRMSQTPNGRMKLKIVFLPFSVQLAVLFLLFLDEYDFLPDEYTLLKLFCWLASLFLPWILQIRLLDQSPFARRLSVDKRLAMFAAVSFALSILTLIIGHMLFGLTNHGLLFD